MISDRIVPIRTPVHRPGRARHAMHRSDEKPWVTWVVIAIIVLPILLMLVFGLIGN
jgi:hypothetical protein